jgi:putative transposase
LDAGP